jgi:hypothetical protein
LHLLEEVVERERALADDLLGPLPLLDVVGRLRLLDEREHVAHAEDAARHAVGVEGLEVLELLAGTGEEDRLADHFLYRQRRTTARVAVDLREDHAVETDRVLEGLRDVDRFLSGHRVDDEQRVVRLHRVTDVAQLVHQLGVDLQTARGVDDDDVAAEARGFFERVARDRDGIARLRVERHVDTTGEHAQLLDRGRALEVGTDEQRLQPLGFQEPRELACGGRLSGALQAGEHEHGRRLGAHRQLAGLAAERLDQLVVDDLDELLRRVQVLRQLRADGLLLDALDERPHDADVHVGFEERHADLTRDLVDVLLAEASARAEATEDSVETVG